MNRQKNKVLSHSELIRYCSNFIELDSSDEAFLIEAFHPLTLKRKSFLLEEGKICDFIAFVNTGIFRHFHIKDGNEITCDITLPHSFITDFKSLNQTNPSNYYFQVLKDSELLIIKKDVLLNLYETNKKFEKLGRIMAENIAQRTIEIVMSLSSDKPIERVQKLLANQPELFQLVPQRYLANLLGLTPESLSRIRARQYPL